MTPTPRSPSSALRTAALLSGVLISACEGSAVLPLAYLRAAAGDQSGLLGPPVPLPGTERVGLADDLPPPVNRPWATIAARDTLVALLTFNSTGYFIHQGEPLGYEYELLDAFAKAKEMALRTIVVTDRQLILEALNLGEGDVAAARIVALPELQGKVGLTTPLYSTRAVIVQRAPEAVAAAADSAGLAGDSTDQADVPIPDSVALSARLLNSPAELAGQEVHVPAGSDYYDRIVELSDSLGENIELVEVENAEQIEPLIEAVSEGRIRLTISQENLAELSKARFSNIIAQPALGEAEPVAWAVRANDPAILQELNAWLAEPETERLRAQLYTKYFVDRRGYQRRVEDELFASETGQISQFDSLLAREAKGIGWDWRLLAAQVAQESRFDPRARSWAGARGLLQLMPRTAREVGVRNPTDPTENVAGGVRYLARLSELWRDDIPDEAERLKFVLASYNAGRGHVLDAQRLAEKHGDDPQRWDDVAYWLLQKSKPSVYRDRVVRYGYVRGLEPVQYVSRILERYDRYRGIAQ
jgi:membrane-bound lytic murein transglycosylase F